MTNILAANIVSPLGYSVKENFEAIGSGQSALGIKEGYDGVAEPSVVSVFSPQQAAELSVEGFSKFESIVVQSVRRALAQTEIDTASDRTIFILSTTKANVACLGAVAEDDCDYRAPGAGAAKIASYLGFTTAPIVVCNACISGVTAQILADRLLRTGRYDTAVVCGADMVSAFNLAGFHSFKALSPAECRPFDIERLGLNIGDAAATVVLSRTRQGKWAIIRGSLNNDAYHQSAPAPDGEGLCRAASEVMRDIPVTALATVCAHGTATMFNDQMESKAIQNAGLSEVSVTAYKGWYGHTFGASGVMESILSMESVDRGELLAVRGFEELGVSGRIKITDVPTAARGDAFLKLISGFGGCNGALLYAKDGALGEYVEKDGKTARVEPLRSVRITPSAVEIDAAAVAVQANGAELTDWIYRNMLEEYPRYFKMDAFSRLVYAASQLLLKDIGTESLEDTAIVLCNSSSSVIRDREHIATLGSFPSPSVFLYTLPNVSVGEVAIKNGIKGETTFYILENKNETLMKEILEASAAYCGASRIIFGWVDMPEKDKFEADLKLYKID